MGTEFETGLKEGTNGDSRGQMGTESILSPNTGDKMGTKWGQNFVPGF
jgi:hypothetical protein